MSATAPTLADGGVSLTFPCPKCRREHPWAAEHAGRTARCPCGNVLKVPAALATPQGDWETNPTPAGPPVPSSDDSQVPAFLRMSHGTGGDEPLSAEVEAELAAVAKYGEEDPTKPDPRRDTHVPAALLAIGFVVTAVDFGLSWESHAGAAVAAGVLIAGLKLIVGMLFMFGGALAAARFGGINFGPIGPALLKLAGLCLAPSALGDLTTTLLGGDGAVAQIGWAVRIILYWTFVSYLFRLDGIQTTIVVVTITIVKVVTVIALASLALLAFAPNPSDGYVPADDADSLMSGVGADDADAGADFEE